MSENAIPCRYCREPIDPLSRLCKHCKSDLSWKAWLPLGSTALAIVTAVIAVLTAATPGVRRVLFEPQDAKLSANVIASNATELNLLVVNDGSRTGFVPRVLLTVTWTKGHPENHWDQLNLRFDPKPDPIVVIEPNSSKFVTFAYRASATFEAEQKAFQARFATDMTPLMASSGAAAAAPELTCDLSVSTVNSEGRKEDLHTSPDCSTFFKLLMLRRMEPVGGETVTRSPPASSAN